MDESRFSPFYERLPIRHLTGKVLMSAILGLGFLAIHYASVGSEAMYWSWFLGALISTAMLCVYYATHTLRTILPEMNVRLSPHGHIDHLLTLRIIVRNRNLVIAGLLFGVLNCGFGIAFGLP